MKKLMLLLMVLIYLPMYAQINIVEVKEDTDTLVYKTIRGEEYKELALGGDSSTIYLYKNKYGYLIKSKTLKFHIGETPIEAIESLEKIESLIENDIDTRAVIYDAIGDTLYCKTAYMEAMERKATYIKSDRIYISSDKMLFSDGFNHSTGFCFKNGTIGELKKYLKKQ